MKLNSIRIVLVATSHPGNIGSTARAMKTMGLQRLYLVTPKVFPAQEAHELAAGSDDILNQAIMTESLAAALKGCHLIFATSARARDLALPGFLPGAAAEFISKADDNTEVAFVFGREHAGLTNDELLHCHYHINIPSNPSYSSLNLAQAVQIIAYELRMALLSPTVEVETGNDKRATSEEVELFYTHLHDVLVAIDFLKPSNPKKLLQRLRRLFNRSQLESKEINILRGILTHVQNALKRDIRHE
jgi:tRNA (cytidine32/uridine32-2'-O)-methyltransferase